MRKAFLKAVGAGGLMAAMTASVALAQPTLTGMDVGTPGIAGSHTVAAGKITVTGSGADIWGTADDFYYAYFTVTGDFDYSVKVDSFVRADGSAGTEWSKAELMARLPADQTDTTPFESDPFIANMVNLPSSDTTGGGVAGVNNRGPQWRAHRTGDLPTDPANTTAYTGDASWTTPNPTYPPNPGSQWLRLERVGSIFFMYTSNDGTTWNSYNPYAYGWDTKNMFPPGADSPAQSMFDKAWPAKINLGLAVTSHADATTATAVFSDFKAFTPVPIVITQQPVASVDAVQNGSLTITVAATGDPVHYEWQKDGVALGWTNSVGPTLTIPLLKTTDAGNYKCRVYGGGTSTLTAGTVVTVAVDLTPPTVADSVGSPAFTTASLIFSEPVTAPTATTAGNYTITPSLGVTAAELSADGKTVKLTTAKQAEGTWYTVAVKNVQDTAMNVVATGTSTQFKSFSLAPGYALVELWTAGAQSTEGLDTFLASRLGYNGVAATDPVAPNSTTTRTAFATGWNLGDNYNGRISGFFIAPETADYVFFCSSDDNSYLMLSTDANPANKKKIASEPSWNNENDWTGTARRAAGENRSDVWLNWEWPNGTISLVKGASYYIEGAWHEGGGGDGFGATYRLTSEADSVVSGASRISGTLVASYVDTSRQPPAITVEPVSAIQVNQGESINISVTATANGPITYQWTLNNRDIPGATSNPFVIASAKTTDIGQYRVKVSTTIGSYTGSIDSYPCKVLVNATGVFNIEAEDFDNGGAPMAEASVMPYKGLAYAGLGGTFDVDYHNLDALDATEYRTGMAAGQNADTSNNDGGQWGKTRAGEWDMTTNYKIGWVGSGDWGNYTRTFPSPAKSYYVFHAGCSDNLANSSVSGTLGYVTEGLGTTTQTVQPIGVFDGPGTKPSASGSGWGPLNLVAMTESVGGPIKTVELAGTKTFRWAYNNGDADYLLFIPVAAAPSVGTAKVAITGSNVTISEVPASGSKVESAPAITGPWGEVGTTPFTEAVGAANKFYRLKQ